MIRILFATALLFLGLTAHAKDMGVYGGLNLSEFDGDNVSYNSNLGFDFGLTTLYNFDSKLDLRTGAGLSFKSSTAEYGTRDADIDFIYIEVPATALYHINNAFGIFGGLNLDIELSDDCDTSGSSCKVRDPETLVFNLSIGSRFEIDRVGTFEVILDKGITDMYNDTSLDTTLAVRYIHFL